ncbi:hypothetical protein D4764_18G0009350 [Takifugu flavidus]|uniref:Ig-like domain-containing protein n=1 Tax=Takifugu flavidus TaxID=433684 RepID=A0A5C6NTY1_9TELE|nr:hypothetical protein D4764_18G0009350 [Takifugu flavidus]
MQDFPALFPCRITRYRPCLSSFCLPCLFPGQPTSVLPLTTTSASASLVPVGSPGLDFSARPRLRCCSSHSPSLQLIDFVRAQKNGLFPVFPGLPEFLFAQTPDSVSVSADVTQEGAEMVLSCDVTNVAPLQALRVKWYIGNDTVHTQMFNDTSRTPASVISTLRTTAGREDNGVEFRCAAELHLGPNGPELVPTVTSSAYTAVVLCGFLSFHPSLQFYH